MLCVWGKMLCVCGVGVVCVCVEGRGVWGSMLCVGVVRPCRGEGGGGACQCT